MINKNQLEQNMSEFNRSIDNLSIWFGHLER